MRDQLWNVVCETKRKELYFYHYQEHTRKIDYLISGITAFTSAGCVSAWGLWGKLPWLWAALIILAQALQVLKPIFPFSKQLASLKFLVPEMARLRIRVEYEWNKSNASDDEYLNELIMSVDKEYEDLLSKYVGDTHFPPKHKIIEKSDTDRNMYLATRFNIGDGLNAKEDCTDTAIT